MTTEELMKPRFKIIADYPSNPHKVGHVLEYTGDGIWDENNIKTCSKYPAIFRPLQWWQERKPEEMPEYVKGNDIVGKLEEAYSHNLKDCVIVTLPNGNAIVSHITNFLPATEAEYTHFINR